MDYSQLFAISAAGMEAERTRVEVAALNLANANTVSSPDAPGYVPQRVLLRSTPMQAAEDFAQQVAQGLGPAAALPASVPEALVQPTGAAPRLVHDPGHPLANAAGMVAQPGVDTATEMVTIVSAMRAYEANVAVAGAARTLALKTLDIGGGA
jgi:flagellar basal-body rod protein FlgC